MDNRPNTRHKDEAMITTPDLSVSVKDARGGFCPGNRLAAGDSPVALEEAMRCGSGEIRQVCLGFRL